MIKIVNNHIDTESVLQSVQSENCGASLLFVGATRKFTKGRETMRLEYDCYETMALKQMEGLVNAAKGRFEIENVTVVHRVGEVKLGEASIAVAVSSPHRKACFEAGQWLIDELKLRVPIWKKEFWADGSTEWVHPEGAIPLREHVSNPSQGGDS